MAHSPSLTTTQLGVIAAVSAYTLWAIAPIYFKALEPLRAQDILAHRIVWSFILLFIICFATGRMEKVKRVLRSKRTFFALLFTSIVISINWMLFIWSVQNGYILEASLGYYINPLVSVLLGVIFLSESLDRARKIAVLFCLLAVAFEVFHFGRFPLIAMVLAISFGLYGLIRKIIGVDSVVGLMIETALIFPIAVGHLLFTPHDAARFTELSLWKVFAIIMAGPITVVPLLFFAMAANRISLNALGLFQYIAPTGMFLLAIFLFGEYLDTHKLITFGLIWGGLSVLLVKSGILLWRQKRR